MPNYKTTLVNLARIVNVDTNYVPTTVKVANLGTGTPSATTYLRGDGTWATVAGGTSNLQTVLNLGNTANNSGTNVGSIILTDSTSTKSLTLTGLGVETQQIRFDGLTSGNLIIKASATTTSYGLTFPSAQATASGQALTNDGTGILSWTTIVSGASNLQAVLNVGNTANNAGANVGTIVLTDSASTKSSTFSGLGLSAQQIVFNGATSGTVTLKASTTTTSYNLTWPSAQASSGQLLGNDGTGTLSWVTVSGGGGGTVTSIGMTVPTALSVTPASITTFGTFALTWNGQQIPTSSLGSGTPDATKYLRGDGNWTTLPSPGTGTVTSINMSVPTGFSVSGVPITTSGTIALAYSGQIPPTSLGTGTPNNTNFLRGDGAWISVTTSITSPQGTIAIGTSAGATTVDIAQQGATTNQVLSWNGTKWAPANAGTTPNLQQVLTVGGSTGGQNISLTGATLLSGATTNYSFSDGTQGQVLQKGTGNTVVWSTSSGSSTPFDLSVWANASYIEYVTDETYAQIAVNGTFSAFTSLATATITLASALTGFPNNSYVIGQTPNGLTVSGFYSQPTSVTQLYAERSAGFQPSTSYAFTWRAGRRGISSLNIDANAPSTPSRVDQLGFTSNLTLTADGTNAGRYITDINITAEKARTDAEIALKIGDYANPSSTTWTQLGTTTLSTTAGWFNGANNTSELDIATANYTTVFNWLTGLGATAPVGGTGNWTLPATNIYISDILTPTSTEYGIISQVNSNSSTSSISIFVPRNSNLNSGSAQGIFYIDGSRWLFQTAPQASVVRTVLANSVNSLNAISAAPVTIAAGSGISINTDVAQRTVTITNSASGGTAVITTLPVINFTGSATASAGQTFQNVGLLSYTSADYMSVSVNGSMLNRSNYSLTTQQGATTGTLQIDGYIPANAAIQVQPAGSGGSSGTYDAVINTSTIMTAGANNLIVFAAPTSLTSFTFSGGVFTATRNVTVAVNLQVVMSGLTNATQVATWISRNGTATTGTRYGQRTLNSNVGATNLGTTADSSSVWVFRLARNDTIQFYVFSTSTTNYDIGTTTTFGGELTRLSITELFG